MSQPLYTWRTAHLIDFLVILVVVVLGLQHELSWLLVGLFFALAAADLL